MSFPYLIEDMVECELGLSVSSAVVVFIWGLHHGEQMVIEHS